MDPIDAPSGVVVSLGSFTLWIGVCRPRRGFSVRQTATPKLTTRSLICLWKILKCRETKYCCCFISTSPLQAPKLEPGNPLFLSENALQIAKFSRSYRTAGLISKKLNFHLGLNCLKSMISILNC